MGYLKWEINPYISRMLLGSSKKYNSKMKKKNSSIIFQLSRYLLGQKYMGLLLKSQIKAASEN